MTTPAYQQNQPGKMHKPVPAYLDESIRSKLPHKDGPVAPADPEPVYIEPVAAPPPEPAPRRWKFLPAFWTIASVISMAVNLVLIIAILLLFQLRGRLPELQVFATDTASGLLGGLYHNFVKMDQANIRTNIHIEEQIPVKFTLNVSGETRVTLTQPVTIRGASVSVSTGGLNIRDANATIILPAGVELPIFIDNLVVPVDQQVPAVLDVPVDIPLDQTELHEPFVGLQKVVEPWYCLIEPDATVNGLQVCARNPNPSAAPVPVEPTFEPTPVGTVIP